MQQLVLTVGVFRCVLDRTMSKKSFAVGTGAIALRPFVAIVVNGEQLKICKTLAECQPGVYWNLFLEDVHGDYTPFRVVLDGVRRTLG